MYSEIFYQILLVVLIVAVIFLIFVLARLYLILSDINDASRKIKSIVEIVYSTVIDIKTSVTEYQALIKAFVVTITSVSGIRDIIDKLKGSKSEKESNV